ncbi:MAG: hypothetical protein QOG23_4869 [Blastocatellia bacterium]|jgi:hypothetical protein|nr:hypothetical protein [Blastocatellia bacterium]
MSDAKKLLLRSGLAALAVSALLAVSSRSAIAQCVMCRASIGQNSLFARNLNLGVLVLLVPPVAMFCTIFVLAFRSRKSS